MALDLWLAFVAASTAPVLIPEPTLPLVLSYALLAERLRQTIRKPGVIVWLARGGGEALIGMGAMTAALRRNA